MDYTAQINQIADYLKTLTKELGNQECIKAYIKPYVYVYVNGAPNYEIEISDENPHYKYFEYYNEYTKWTNPKGNSAYADGKHSPYFGAFREIPESIARELILNWKSIKETLLNELQKLKDENAKIAAFEV